MNINDLTIGQAKELAAMFGNAPSTEIDNGMVGKYVIVRCKDAVVHAGELVAYNGREAVLDKARRLWYWKPKNGAKFLSGVAAHGLHNDSKIGEPIHVHLTETCEIILCTALAATSIAGMASDE
tara:strand:- start:284 stop:655 length:372 start_codon:yes stop_codon:yes gene_type:complete